MFQHLCATIALAKRRANRKAVDTVLNGVVTA
jgi:hypothetical protein